MKKLNIFAYMLVAIAALSACSTDRDDNPILSIPEDGSFALYAPGMLANSIDLDNSKSITFQVDQPNYGYTANITYMMEFAASEDGDTWSSWQTINTTSENPLAIEIPTEEIAGAVTMGLIELGRAENDFPLAAKVKARVHAFLTGKMETTSIYSKEIIFDATTSYVLPPSPIYHFYLVGLPGWTGANAITALFYPEGSDIYSYTSKFTGSYDLKFWYEDDAEKEVWNNAYGCENDGDNAMSGKIVNTDAGAISAPSAEFYTFSIDYQHMTYTWTKLDNQNPTEYDNISIIGSWTDDWSEDVDLTQVTPHNWYVQYTFANDVEFKFRANRDWGTNWGATWTVSETEFAALGVGGGDNIKCAKGTYRFYLNDITNALMVVPVTSE